MAADLQGGIDGGVIDSTPFSTLEHMSPRELEHMGRLTEPLIATSLDDRFRRVSWDEAIDRASAAIARVDPNRSYYYFSAGLRTRLVSCFSCAHGFAGPITSTVVRTTVTRPPG